jgi:hypothetical protein
VNNHRLVKSTSFRCVDLRRPFSNFDFVEANFRAEAAIRRLFSQARSHGCKTLVIEDIVAEGLVEDENEEIKRRYADHQMADLKRLTFWEGIFSSEDEFRERDSKHLAGFAILKHDKIPSRKVDQWHIFDSVFRKYPHRHNCVPAEQMFSVRAGGKAFDLEGVLYCQQNQLNKACAQVALRSLCALHISEFDLPYSRINRLADAAKPGFDPSDGLNVPQIQAVLKKLGIQYSDVDYTKEPASARKDMPYQKFLYAGVESGSGALLGFEYEGPKAKGERHILPFFGHTFNQDTWVPSAEVAYFHVGEKTRYIPSESWLSSFIGHDDNFGSNFCIPRLYVTRDQAKYVVALHPSGVSYSGVLAEAIAIDYLYSLLPHLSGLDAPWLTRLVGYAKQQKVVLRAVAMPKQEYTKHLRIIRDWQSRAEDERLCRAIEDFLPKTVWMIEVSIPELFPTNLRKLGEIVLDASKLASSSLDFKSYKIARFPGRFMLLKNVDPSSAPDFFRVPSGLRSHTPVYQASHL